MEHFLDPAVAVAVVPQGILEWDGGAQPASDIRRGEPAARPGRLRARSGVWSASSPARARRRSAHDWEHEMGDAVALKADRWVAE
jgi:hypothetical protein